MKILKNKFNIFLSFIFILFAQNIYAVESKDPIKLTLHDWTGQLITTNIMAEVLKEAGYNVELVPADYIAQFAGLQTGDLHVAMEMWETTGRDAIDEYTADGRVVNVGTTGMDAIEEWWYPSYMKEKCPGLPNWEALKDPACAANFATADSDGKGRWLEGPYEWHTDVMPNRLKGLGIDDLWTVKFAGSADALWAELKAAKAEGRGTVIFNWSPNFTDAAGFTFIEFPPYFEGCRLEQGGSLETTGCGSPKGWLKKAAHIKFPLSHPDAYKFYTKMSFTAPQIGTMADLVDNQGLSHADAAAKFIADNRDLFDLWKK